MKKQTAFTLIELLVVVAIIGLLASVMMVALNSSRTKAKIARVQADLKQLRTAIAFLETDVGKWPNGCPMNQAADPEVFLDGAQAGLKSAPTVGITGSGCEWTAQDVANWKGPYVSSAVDPWSRSYYFDPDYCDETGTYKVYILSFGLDGVEQYKSTSCGGSPSSDDIILLLR